MGFRRRLARFNRVATNPVQGTWAWLVPPWAVLVHRGRRTGRVYRTPVLASVRKGRLRVMLLYGEQSDWVRNLLAGGGQVVRGGRTYQVIDPRIEHGSFGTSLVATLGTPSSAFGRGPRAGTVTS
jgi:deazaflavin-dependent oxidoreductase (nitroreductase family)